MQARLQGLYISLGGLPQQPPVQHRVLFQCFAFKDSAALQALGLQVALDAIAGEAEAEHCNNIRVTEVSDLSDSEVNDIREASDWAHKMQGCGL